MSDSCLGIGDLFLEHGRDYSTADDLKKILTTRSFHDSVKGVKDDSYSGREVLLYIIIYNCLADF